MELGVFLVTISPVYVSGHLDGIFPKRVVFEKEMDVDVYPHANQTSGAFMMHSNINSRITNSHEGKMI